jgi:integrative and conjugative element protein (TIGR02256 family)
MPELYIAGRVIDALHHLPARPWEVGGWLLGYWTVDRVAVYVTQATPPGPRGTPVGVWISGRSHRERFDAAWEASGGIVTFLGDWHTHPGGPTSPSGRDADAARQLAEDGQYGTPEPVLALVAVPRWRGRRTRRHSGWWWRSIEGKVRHLVPTIIDSLPPAAAHVPAWRWPRTR